jgi:hypothetical protein
MKTVAALYIDPRGPYPKLPGVDCWDETRDARVYQGPFPVVAHPPCGPWGRLRMMNRHQPRELAPYAVEQVRRFGGVLEHPSGSLLWRECGLPFPGEFPDAFGGWSLAVNQCDFGHVALKPTWLYLVGIAPSSVNERRAPRKPTHRVARDRSRTARGALKECSAELRRRTPVEFAEWLVSLARAVRARELAA